MDFPPRLNLKALPGLSLVEILIAMTLMGFVMLSISNFVVKGNVYSSSLNMRFKEASEIHSVVQDIQADLHRGAYISPNSFNRRLEYTTYDPGTGSALKKVYGICYYSAIQTDGTVTSCPLFGGGNTVPYLKLSLNGGVTWGSPYRISNFNKYRMSGTPKFLYAHASNDCWDYADDNSNGVLGSGDSTKTQVPACSSSSSFGVANSSKSPSASSKVVLSSFAFTTGTGSPEALRNLPPYIFIAVAPGPVRSTMAAVSPGVKDSQLVQSFSTDPAVNVTFPTGFVIRGLAWDSAHEALLLSSENNGTILRCERNGVFINTPMPIYSSTIKPFWLTMEADGQTAMALEFTGSSYNFYRFNLSGGSPLVPITGPLALASINNPKALAYNPNYPDYFYNPSDTSSFRIEQRNKYTGATTGAVLNTDYWALPAAFTAGTDLSGMFIEPVTGNFYVLRNATYTSGGRNYVDVYKILRTDSTATLEFSIDLTDLVSSASGVTGWFQMAYDPVLNRLFLSDRVSNRVYEVSPPKLISPRT